MGHWYQTGLLVPGPPGMLQLLLPLCQPGSAGPAALRGWGAVWVEEANAPARGSALAGTEPLAARLVQSNQCYRERATLSRLHFKWKLKSAVKQVQKSL